MISNQTCRKSDAEPAKGSDVRQDFHSMGHVIALKLPSSRFRYIASDLISIQDESGGRDLYSLLHSAVATDCFVRSVVHPVVFQLFRS